MKRYVRSSAENKPMRTLEISLDVIAFVEELAVTASEDTYDLPIADKKIAENIATDYEEIISAVHGILRGQGFSLLDHHQSNQSNSLYFTFCRETELEIEKVELVVGLRVSDHDLPRWKDDKSNKEARKRMEQKLQDFADDNQELLNSDKPEDEAIETEMLFIRYENEFYSVYGDVFNKIRQKIKDFKRKRGIE